MDWTPIFYWTGVGVWVSAGVALMAFMLIVAANSVKAARFVLRIWTLAPKDRRTARFLGGLAFYWLRLSVFASNPPDMITSTETGEVAYWPGREQRETFTA
jgi:hypothetical protein